MVHDATFAAVDVCAEGAHVCFAVTSFCSHRMSSVFAQGPGRNADEVATEEEESAEVVAS
jgi:hypothetical protein